MARVVQTEFTDQGTAIIWVKEQSAFRAFFLSKIFRRKLDVLFERYFITIITATFLFMLLLVVLYNTQIHLRDIPVIVDQVIMGMFTVNMMINNFSINHEYRMMQFQDNK